MGVRLVQYNRYNNNGDGSLNRDHDELINRDLLNQHPIYAITGLQEVLNILEDSIQETNTRLNQEVERINSDIESINKEIEKIIDIINNLNVIKDVEDTYSVDMSYDKTTKILKADVKVYKDTKNDSNSIQVLADGLYVPKTMTKDSNTITWSVKSLGETLKEIYQNGIKFSHYPNSWSNVYSTSEANAWYWDDNLQSFVQPRNTNCFTGFVTQNFYDYYTHTVTLRSTDSDSDRNGVIIGFVFDENNHPHTLSILTNKESGVTNSWRLVYDYYLPDQQVIYNIGNNQGGGTRPSGYSSGGWNSITNGITVRVTKYKNIVTATCSDWNSKTINEDTKITIDLNDYSWGYLFQGPVRYGYCNESQAYSFFQDINFLSDNQASSSLFIASVKISKEANNGIVEKDDGIYCEEFNISKKDNNILTKEPDGYFVQGPSKQPDNAIELLDDGYYVRTHSNIKTVIKINHGFEIGDFIFYHPNDGYKKALAIDDYDSNIVGMVTKVIDDNTFEYMWSGFYATDIFNSSNGYTQGMPLYISDVDPGKVTQVQPDISKAVGYPVENIGLIISIERGIQYNQEASIGDFKTSANTYNVRSDGFIRVVENVDYKQTLIERLINALNDTFKSTYMVFNDTEQTVRFINIDDLYISNSVPDGFNLFIKAF